MLKSTLLLITTIFLGYTQAFGGVVTTVSTAPTTDAADIANFPSAVLDVGGAAGHIWSNRPVHGQTFTTGNHTEGYDLSSVSLQTFFASNPGGTFTVRIGSVSGDDFTPLATETASAAVSSAALDYYTFAFDNAVHLNSNTLYAFDWTVSADGFVTTASDVAGSAADTYSGGVAFSSGASAVPDDANLVLHTFDRVFHANLAETASVSVPEPSLGMGVVAVVAVAGLIRRRQRKTS